MSPLPTCGLSQARRISRIRRAIAAVDRDVHLSGVEAQRVFAYPAAGGGVVPAVPVVLEGGVGVEGAAGVGEEAVDGAGLAC